METEGRALSDGEVGDQPDQIPSEYRIERRTEMEKTENVRMRGLTPFAAFSAKFVSDVKESSINNVRPMGSMDVDRDGCFQETNPFIFCR